MVQENRIALATPYGYATPHSTPGLGQPPSSLHAPDSAAIGMNGMNLLLSFERRLERMQDELAGALLESRLSTKKT